MKYHWLAAAVLTVGCSSVSVAQTESAFNRITAEVMSNNPELAAIAAENKAEHYGNLAENNLADPEIEGEYLFAPESDDNRWSVAVSQSFDWPGAYKARRRAADARYDAAAKLLRSQQLDMRLKIRGLLIEIIGIDQQLDLIDQLSANLESQVSAAENALERGQLTRLDLAKIKFELINLDDQRSQLELTRSNLTQQLCGLNGDCHVDLSGLDGYPAMKLMSEQAYLDAFDRFDPYSDAAKAEVEAANKDIDVARMSRYPGFSLGYTHLYEEGTHFNGITASVTLPLFSSRHKMAEATARAEAANFRLGNYTATRYAAIRHQTATARQLNSRLGKYESAFNQADYQADLRKLLEAGQINMIDYITELNYYLDIRRQYLQTICEYMLTLNDLNRYD